MPSALAQQARYLITCGRTEQYEREEASSGQRGHTCTPEASSRVSCTLLAVRSCYPFATDEDLGLNAAMQRWSTKDADEELASRVLQTTLSAPVISHDDRAGHSKYDLEIEYPDGRRGAAEVVSARDPDRTELSRASARLGYTQDEKLNQLWVVRVTPGTRIRHIRSRLPALLVSLESRAIRDIRRFDHGDMADAVCRLGIHGCSAYPSTAKHPPGYYVLPDAFASWAGDGDDVAQFCGEFLADDKQADVLAKLRKSDLNERHAIIILTTDQLGPHTVVDMGLLPRIPPIMPADIDWLWVIASKAPPVRASYWHRTQGWSNVMLSQ